MLPQILIAIGLVAVAVTKVWSSRNMSAALDRLTAAVSADTAATNALDVAVTNLLADPTGTAPVATAAELDALSAQLETNALAFKATIEKVVAATAPTVPAPPPTP